MWTIWNDRNTELHDGKRRPAVVSKKFIKDYIRDFNNTKQRQSQPVSQTQTKWQPPPRDFVKVNFDGSFKKETNSGGIGIVIRNAEGEAMGAKASRIDNVNDPFLVEAFAAVEALKLASECGFKEIILEGDALCIIKKLQSKAEDRSILSYLIEEGRQKTSCFFKCKIQHCLRFCNEVAHQLAKLGSNAVEECIWIEELPICIQNSVDAEM